MSEGRRESRGWKSDIIVSLYSYRTEGADNPVEEGKGEREAGGAAGQQQIRDRYGTRADGWRWQWKQVKGSRG